MQHRQYFLMLERAPGYFSVVFFVRESKHFMVEQNLILFYPWCYWAFYGRTKLDFILPVVLLEHSHISFVFVYRKRKFCEWNAFFWRTETQKKVHLIFGALS